MSDWIGGCPNCGHDMNIDHDREYGCSYGWRWDNEGTAVVDGCDCPLALASDA